MGLSRRVLLLGGFVLAAGEAAWLLSMTESAGTQSAVRALVVSELFLAAGLVAETRRPDTRTGALMALFSALYALGFAINEALLPWRYTTGLVAVDSANLVLAYLVLAFPAGRLPGWWERGLAAALGVAILAVRPYAVAFTPPSALCASCAPAGNLLYAGAGPVPIRDVLDVQSAVLDVLTALVVVTLLARFARASRPAKRVMAPLVLTTALLAAKAVIDGTFIAPRLYFADQVADWVETPQFLLFASIPVAYLAGLLQTRVTRTTVGRLVADLARGPAAGSLRDALARSLGDPGMRLGLYAPDLGHYVDESGGVVELPREPERTHVTPVRGSDGPLAVLIHDPALLEDPGLLDAVTGAARLALENARLRAVVQAQLEQVSQSRARIVEAADEERRRIERNLHDGAQQRLVSLGMALRLIGAHAGEPGEVATLVARAEEQARSALDELRDLARGIHPAMLTEQGLSAALRSLADHAPVPVVLGELPTGRLQPAVEAAAYYTCCEAIANAAKYAGASAVTVDAVVATDAVTVTVADDGRGGAELDGGSGLRGLTDRVEAVGGRLVIESQPGSGTRVVATLPLTAP